MKKRLWRGSALSTEPEIKPQRPLEDKATFLMPYLILVSFTVPSMLVTAYVRPTAGYDALVMSGWFSLVKLAVGLLLFLASVCALIYLFRASGRVGRVVVVVCTVALWAGFRYIS